MSGSGKTDRREFMPGDGLVITANVGVRDDDDPGASVDLKGVSGVVEQCANPVYTCPETGEQKVLMRTEDGSLVGTPTRAVAKMRYSQ